MIRKLQLAEGQLPRRLAEHVRGSRRGITVLHWSDPRGTYAGPVTRVVRGSRDRKLAAPSCRGRHLDIARLCGSRESVLVRRCMGMARCGHQAHVKIRRLPESVVGCEECLVAGTPWLHLRICLECGHVACCDESPQRHANAHANASGHPIIRSLEPGEQWTWCYIDRIAMLAPSVTGTTRIPPSPLGSRDGDRCPRRP